MADPEGSVFLPYWRDGDAAITSGGSRIEGIGRPQVEPSFVRALVDHMLPVTNIESINAMRALSEQLGRRVGPSTGTNFHAMLLLAEEMLARGETGSIMSLICDAGERYLNTYFDAAWVNKNFGDCSP